MKHSYKTKSYWKRGLEKAINSFVNVYALLFVRKKEFKNSQEPINILVCTLGHLGDALMVTYVFPFIVERFPNIKIDVLTSKWNKPILENNPYIHNLIFFNHFRMNRLKIPIWSKISQHFRTSRSAVKAIGLNDYDISIEGRISHPNGSLLCYRGRVKRRIGFSSGGFGSLLTDQALVPTDRSFHLLEAILSELKLLGINKHLAGIKPYFKEKNKNHFIKNNRKSGSIKQFIIMHVETGKDYLPERLINSEFWIKIVSIILEITEYDIVMCGTSPTSIKLLEDLSINLPQASARLKNSINKLSLDNFFSLSSEASFAITVDSLAAHFCAVNCDTISIYKNGYGVLYFPISNNTAIVIHNHSQSKDAMTHPNIINKYVEQIESQTTIEIFTKSILKLSSSKQNS